MSEAPPVESVLITDQLASRPARSRDRAAEHAALMHLVDELGNPSRHIFQRVAEIALELCGAGSAGVSVLEQENGKEMIRWQAIAGAMRDHLWNVMPRDHSPATIVLRCGTAQLFHHPGRHYRHLAELKPRTVEELLVPLTVDGEAIGAVWVASHDADRQFDGEDAQLLGDLSRLASAASAMHGVLEGLRESSRRKDEFLGVLSHEMRNPLAAMSNAVRFLTATSAPSTDEARAHAVLQRQLAQATRLAEDLLDVARISTGAFELRRERTDLVAAVRLGREAALPALAEYDREIVVELPDTPLLIEGDPARLTQIVTNLLTNTARRTRSGGRATLTMRIDGPDAVLTVSSETEDVAAGWGDLPPSRERAARSHDPESEGIGLTLARQLTEMHGGRVATVDVGTARQNGFELRFPLADPVLLPVRQQRTDPLRVREPRRRERVLIVDDSVDSSDSLAMLLQSWGHEVRTAQGAVAGLRLEWEFEPHAVILDIEMPGKNGYEVAAELRVRRRRELLLVALSGHAREEDRARSLAAGFDHHLTKPANVEMLRRLLS